MRAFLACHVFAAALLAACQQGGASTDASARGPAVPATGGPSSAPAPGANPGTVGDAPGAGESLRDDVHRLCNVLELSGAAQRPPEERIYTTSTWLGDNLRTEAARDLLVRFQQSADKAALLRAEAARQGLADCPLAASWD
jgi:hypothetical protein